MPERLPLIQKLAAMLESKTNDALSGMEDVDQVSFRANYSDELIDDPGFEDKQDIIIGQVVGRYTETLPQICTQLFEWFGVIEVKKSQNDDTDPDQYVFVISEHHKPEGWNEIDDM